MEDKIEDFKPKIIEDDVKMKRENSTSSICNQSQYKQMTTLI